MNRLVFADNLKYSYGFCLIFYVYFLDDNYNIFL